MTFDPFPLVTRCTQWNLAKSRRNFQGQPPPCNLRGATLPFGNLSSWQILLGTTSPPNNLSYRQLLFRATSPSGNLSFEQPLVLTTYPVGNIYSGQPLLQTTSPPSKLSYWQLLFKATSPPGPRGNLWGNLWGNLICYIIFDAARKAFNQIFIHLGIVSTVQL